jgi:hypothetical protein
MSASLSACSLMTDLPANGKVKLCGLPFSPAQGSAESKGQD